MNKQMTVDEAVSVLFHTLRTDLAREVLSVSMKLEKPNQRLLDDLEAITHKANINSKVRKAAKTILDSFKEIK